MDYRLKAAMDTHGITVKQMAGKLKVTTGTFYAKRRRNSFSVGQAFIILDTLNGRRAEGKYTISELFG